MKVVLDTNVLIAALIARGVCTELVAHCVRQHTILISDFILNELREQLTGKFDCADPDAEEVVEWVKAIGEAVIPVELESEVCRDPNDDSILAAAVGGRADCILTGDRDLLILDRFQNVQIVAPADFPEFEAKQD